MWERGELAVFVWPCLGTAGWQLPEALEEHSLLDQGSWALTLVMSSVNLTFLWFQQFAIPTHAEGAGGWQGHLSNCLRSWEQRVKPGVAGSLEERKRQRET